MWDGTWTRATVVVPAVARPLRLGHAWAAQSAMTSFVLLLMAIGARWAVITTIAHARRGGAYDAETLQVYNCRAHGGICRDRAGRNPLAALGLCAASTRCTRVHCRR